jgi:hypothetical protein
MSKFATAPKTESSYIDIAANGNGNEKSLLSLEAYRRLSTDIGRSSIKLLEVGPGGGSALSAFAAGTTENGLIKPTHVSMLELDGVQSESLLAARKTAERFGISTSLHNGSATDLLDIFSPQSIDILSTSAVIHEVYSYAGGYDAMDKSFQGIAGTLSPGGFYAYRDVYGVKNLSMHERARHIYDRSSWVMFCKLFLDYYTKKADHSYKHYEDRIKLSQGGKTISIDSIEGNTPLSIEAPIGLLRETQRHYITLRDYLWRKGNLGIIPELDDPSKTNDWIDRDRGHKRIHYKMLDDDPILKTMSTLISDDEYIVDGDIFDNTSDVRMGEVLSDIIKNSETSEHWKSWSEWLKREGSETYFYMPIGELLGSVALNSFEVSNGTQILLPTSKHDIRKVDRAYYNRYLESKLSNPLPDGKQLVLFELLSLKDKDSNLQEKISGALGALSMYCSHDVLSNIYTPIRKATK